MRRPALFATGLTAALTLALSPVLVGTAGATPKPAAAAVTKGAAAAAKPGAAAAAKHAGTRGRPAAKPRPFALVGAITATPTVATVGPDTSTATVTVTVTVPRHGKHRATRVSVPVTPKAVVVRNGRRVAPADLRLRDRVVVFGTITRNGVVTVTRVVAKGRVS